MTQDPPSTETNAADADPAAAAAVRLAERAASLGSGAACTAASPGLTGKQRRHLRGLGHALKPIVQVGQHGLTGRLVGAIEAGLDQHELIKVKLLESAPCDRCLAALWVHEMTGAAVAQIVGRVLLVYRADPKKPVIRLPKES